MLAQLPSREIRLMNPVLSSLLESTMEAILHEKLWYCSHIERQVHSSSYPSSVHLTEEYTFRNIESLEKLIATSSGALAQ